MNFNNDEEAQDFFTRLLERLQQAGFNQQCSHIQLEGINRDGSIDHYKKKDRR